MMSDIYFPKVNDEGIHFYTPYLYSTYTKTNLKYDIRITGSEIKHAPKQEAGRTEHLQKNKKVKQILYFKNYSHSALISINIETVSY